MTRADDIAAIRGHLESALYIALGLPVSPHQQCLEAQLRDASIKWPRLFELAEERERKADR